MYTSQARLWKQKLNGKYVIFGDRASIVTYIFVEEKLLFIYNLSAIFYILKKEKLFVCLNTIIIDSANDLYIHKYVISISYQLAYKEVNNMFSMPKMEMVEFEVEAIMTASAEEETTTTTTEPTRFTGPEDNFGD